MGQLYVPDGALTTCLSGKINSSIKVKSQATVKINNKLKATEKDRFTSNFECAKMVSGASSIAGVVGGVIGALGGPVGSFVGFFAGRFLGGLFGNKLSSSLLPSLCSTLCMPSQWTVVHPKSKIEKKKALLEKANIRCLLGGTVFIVLPNISKAISMAALAADSYNDKAGEAINGFSRVSDERAKEILGDNWKELLNQNKDIGFYAALYEDKNGNVVIAYRGTEIGLNDIKEDVVQAMGWKADQYEAAVNLAKKVQEAKNMGKITGEVEITGHSLGGGLATIAGAATGYPTYTYNAAAVHENTFKVLSVDKKNTQHIQAYIGDKDPLNGLQDNREAFLSGAVLASPIISVVGTAGGPLGGAIMGNSAGIALGGDLGTKIGNTTGTVVGGATGATIGGTTGAMVEGTKSAVVGGTKGAIEGYAKGTVAGHNAGTMVGNTTGKIVGGATGIPLGSELGGATGTIVGGSTGEVLGGATGTFIGGTSGAAIEGTKGAITGGTSGAIQGYNTGKDIGGSVGSAVGNTTGKVVGGTVGTVAGAGAGAIAGPLLGPVLGGLGIYGSLTGGMPRQENTQRIVVPQDCAWGAGHGIGDIKEDMERMFKAMGGGNPVIAEMSMTAGSLSRKEILKDAFVNWFTGGEDYTGSGWGHGPRQAVANLLNMDNEVDNLVEAGIKSVLQFDEVNLTGQALEKVKKDPGMLAREDELVTKIKGDPRYGKEAFSYTETDVVGFGGKRADTPMEEQFVDPFNPEYRDTWKVGGNELTWLVRNTNVTSEINIAANGNMVINHSFTDVFDLRPGDGRTGIYNDITTVTGAAYHDVVGGNDELKINAKWTSKR